MLVKLIGNPLTTTNGLNTDNNASAPNTDVSVVKLPEAERIWIVDFVQFSYNIAGPVDGGLTIMDGAKIVFDIDILQNNGFFQLHIPSSPGNNISIILKAGGSGAVGKLNTQCHLEYQ